MRWNRTNEHLLGDRNYRESDWSAVFVKVNRGVELLLDVKHACITACFFSLTLSVDFNLLTLVTVQTIT